MTASHGCSNGAILGFRKETVISRRRFGKSPIFLWKNVTLLDTIMFATHHHNAVYTTTRCLRSSQKASSRRKALVPTRRPTHTPKKSRVDAAVPLRVRQSRFVLLRFCVPFIGETLDRSGMTSSVCRRSHLSLSLSLFCKVCARPRRVCFPREDEDDLLRRRFRRQKRVVSKNRFRFYLELLTKSVPSSFSFPPSLLNGVVLWLCFQSIYR